jgi:putative mycofactocin binding protein MftB
LRSTASAEFTEVAQSATRYRLAPGTQVREEDFGLLFYTTAGPRLYFLASGDLLKERFFGGEWTLDAWLATGPKGAPLSQSRVAGLEAGLDRLREKGVIVAD